ncbi:MAG: DUF4239 domain-containing protein [Acidobacteriia bacterium]|nr:DUF4239 domain-containing protein [Terriglobia bacterium]
MDKIVSAPWFALGLFAGMLLAFGVGWRTGGRRKSGENGSLSGAIDSAIFGLFSLLVAFTFSGAAERYDQRRHLIAEETNNIGTAWLRVDLLSTSDQPPVRELFRRYLDSRLQTYRKLAETPLPEKEMAESVRLQDEIWKRSVVATSGPGAHQDAGKLLLPALNAMIDITTTRAMATLIHPPAAILILLFGLGLASSFLMGLGMADVTRRNLVLVVGYVAITALTVLVIVDLEYPRRGLIRVDPYDSFLRDLRQTMNDR